MVWSEVAARPAQAEPVLDPELSARRVLSGGQAAVGAVALAAVVVMIVIEPLTTIVVLLACWCSYGILTAIHQLLISIAGLRSRPRGEGVAPLADSELPSYTVLVPLYREAAVVEGLVQALGRLEYPQQLLDVKLLVEDDDAETIDALAPVELGPQFEIVRVPPPDGHPRTKPRALNHGLRDARGELVVVFDAEDRPEPDQLRKAAAAFHGAAADVACFQARLDYWNRDTNVLTRYCTAEFCTIFDMLRPGLQRVGAAMPLGGTSNHFPVTLLRNLGAWDPFNVTEDADLGIRLDRAGYRTEMLDSTTYEEANSRLGNWVRQQSRWIKGYMQTWLVHTRRPRRLARELGPRATLHFHLTMLAPVIPVLVGPVGWVLVGLWIAATTGAISTFLPFWLLTLFVASFVLAVGGRAWGQALGLRRRGYGALIPFCLVFPLLRIVKSVAALKAVWQLVTRPSYWEKTVHGLDPDTP